MLSLLLIGLIAIAGIIASISLSDSALKWHHAHSALRIELAQAQNASVSVSNGAIVMLRPAPQTRVVLSRPSQLAVAA